MFKKQITALATATALAVCLALAACGESEAVTGGSASAPAESAPAATAPAESKTTESAPTANAGEYIGEDAAMDVALKDAGFAAADVTELEAELDLDGAVVHYDVEFKQGGMEYDYDIDAVTGEILEAHSEADD